MKEDLDETLPSESGKGRKDKRDKAVSKSKSPRGQSKGKRVAVQNVEKPTTQKTAGRDSEPSGMDSSQFSM